MNEGKEEINEEPNTEQMVDSVCCCVLDAIFLSFFYFGLIKNFVSCLFRGEDSRS